MEAGLAPERQMRPIPPDHTTTRPTPSLAGRRPSRRLPADARLDAVCHLDVDVDARAHRRMSILHRRCAIPGRSSRCQRPTSPSAPRRCPPLARSGLPVPTHGSPWRDVDVLVGRTAHHRPQQRRCGRWRRALAPPTPLLECFPSLTAPARCGRHRRSRGLGCPGCAHTSRRATRSTSERFDFSTPVRLARLLPPPIRFLPLLNPNSPTKPSPTRKCNSTQSQPSAPLREFALRPSAEEARLEYFSPRPTPAPFRRSLPAGPERQRERASPNGRALLIARVTTVSQPSVGCACASLEPPPDEARGARPSTFGDLSILR